MTKAIKAIYEPLEKLIGIGNSGKQDVSKNHDKYLYTKDS